MRGTEDKPHGYLVLSPFSTTSHSLLSRKNMLFETLCDEMVLNILCYLLCLFTNSIKVCRKLFLVAACNSFITLQFVVSYFPDWCCLLGRY